MKATLSIISLVNIKGSRVYIFDLNDLNIRITSTWVSNFDRRYRAITVRLWGPERGMDGPWPSDVQKGHVCRVLLDLIAQSRLQSSLVDWIVIDNSKSKLDIGFVLSNQFCHFNSNPKYDNNFIKKLKFHSASCSNNEAKLLFIKIFKQL